MEKNQTADWTGWCRCMTFFHHMPKFPTTGLQISDHGLHKHSDFQQRIAERLDFLKMDCIRKDSSAMKSKWVTKCKSIPNLCSSESERESHEQESHNRKGAAHLPTVPSNIPLVLVLHWNIWTICNPQNKKTVSQFSSIARSAPSIEWGQFIRVTVLPLPLVDPIPNLVFSKFRHPRRIHCCVQAVCQSTTAAAGAASLSLQIILQDFLLPRP